MLLCDYFRTRHSIDLPHEVYPVPGIINFASNYCPVHLLDKTPLELFSQPLGCLAGLGKDHGTAGWSIQPMRYTKIDLFLN